MPQEQNPPVIWWSPTMNIVTYNSNSEAAACLSVWRQPPGRRAAIQPSALVLQAPGTILGHFHHQRTKCEVRIKSLTCLINTELTFPTHLNDSAGL